MTFAASDAASPHTPTAIVDQTSHKKNFKRVAKQPFQNFSWFGFERKVL